MSMAAKTSISGVPTFSTSAPLNNVVLASYPQQFIINNLLSKV